jgi:EAL domain-containing protein (putative c-di-GMP-specific phosphodiesterase class I)
MVRAGRRTTGLVVAAALCLAAAQQLVTEPVLADLLSAGVAAWAAVAVLLAVASGRLALRWPWLCVAGSAAAVVVGDLLYARQQAAGEDPFPSWADAAYLAAYPPLLAAVFGLGRLRWRRLPAVLDAAVVSVALALPMWFLVGEPALAAGDTSARLIALAYPAADLLVLALVVALLLGPAIRRLPEQLLALAVTALVASDVGFAVAAADGSYVSGSWIDLGWLVQHTLLVVLASTGLGASLGVHEEAAGTSSGRLSRVIAVAALVLPGPVALLADRNGVGTADLVAVCAGTSVIGLLVAARFGVLAGLLRRDLAERSADVARAHAVAEADAVLLEAVDRADVQRAALRAVLAVVVGDGGERCVVGLALGAPGLLEMVAVDGRRVPVQPVAAVDLDALLLVAAPSLAADGFYERPVELPELQGDQLLILALSARSRPVGALVVVADAGRLAMARPALQRVAGQVALALEAVRLREDAEHGRRTAAGVAVPAPRSGVRPGLLSELSRAIANGELVPHYQPIVSLEDGRPRGFEALVRWQHPERGLLLPADFLAQVEQVGLLAKLDGLLLARACADAMLLDPRPSGPYVSVNLSTPMLNDPDTSSLVRSALMASGLPPWRLLLEVTETSALEDADAVARVLGKLRRSGVRIAFDDFGTGYSALSWLQQLPLDVVKVDRSFVDRLPVMKGELPVVEALVRLAQTLRLEVVAEGVEEQVQADALRAMGVTLAQGWLYSRAVPLEQAAALLPEAPGARRNPDGTLRLRVS